jgi:hypothetical protein
MLNATLDFLDWGKSVVDALSPSLTTQSSNYTLEKSISVVVFDSAEICVLTIPMGRTDGFEVWRVGVGAASVRGADGVRLNGVVNGSIDVGAQWGHLRAVRLSSDVWAVS